MARASGRRVALVTGASSGIGAASARRLARDGNRTVLVARRADRLEAVATEIRVAGGDALSVPADLTQEDDRRRVIAETNELVGPVDVLVNNAGFGWYGYASDMPWELAQKMLAVNVEAMVHLTLLVLPGMRARRSGHIINVGSIAGMLDAQGVALYSGTKALVASFSRALFRELRGSGVFASALLAGVVTGTEFYSRASALPRSLRLPAGTWGVGAEQVAERVARLTFHPRAIAYVPETLRLATLIERLLSWVLDLAGPLHLQKVAIEGRTQGPGGE